jgi:hypothetical protein
MLPKNHFLLGLIFSIILYYYANLTFFQVILVFLSAFFIDIDHYIWFIFYKKDFNLKNAYSFLKDQGFHKPTLMIFHTVEFILLIGLLSFLNEFFIYIFIGIIFHSIVDIIYLIYLRELPCREFSIIRYIFLNNKYPNKYLK